MQFNNVALFAYAVSAARFPHAPLAGRSTKTVSVAGANDALSLLQTLAQPAAEVCAGGPVSLGDTCQAMFKCSEAATADSVVFGAAQDQLAMAVGAVVQ